MSNINKGSQQYLGLDCGLDCGLDHVLTAFWVKLLLFSDFTIDNITILPITHFLI